MPNSMELASTRAQGRELDEPSLLVTVPSAPGSRLQFSWGAGTQLRLCEIPEPSPGGSTDTHVATVAWRVPGQSQRCIAYEVLRLYRNLRKQLVKMGHGRGHERRAVLLAYSHEVREVLGTCRSDPVAAPDDEALQLMYESASWHLLELLFLDPSASEGFLAEAFCSWLAEHGRLLNDPPGFDQQLDQALRLADVAGADTTLEYWDVLAGLTACGRLEAAVQLLLAHSVYKQKQGVLPPTPAYLLVDAVYSLLRAAPRLSPRPALAVGVAVDDPLLIAQERRAWHAEVREVLRRGDPSGRATFSELEKRQPATAKGLQQLLGIMLGEKQQLVAACSNWAQLLAAFLMWTRQDARPANIPRLMQQAQQELPIPRGTDVEFLEFFGQLLLAASDRVVQVVVELATASRYCSIGFVAHIFDVLSGYPPAAAVISRPMEHLGCDQQELYLLKYAEMFAAHTASWQLAAEYLAWCPAHGADAMAALLERLPVSLRDQRAVLKALALAERHGLSAPAAALCRRLGAAAAEAGRPAEALKWQLRARDTPGAAALAAPLLSQLASQLAAAADRYDAAPLRLPQLQELAPLMACLPAPERNSPLLYPELQFLRTFLQLSGTLHELQQLQQLQQQPAGGGRGLQRSPGGQQQQQWQAAWQGAPATLSAAYAATRAPVMLLLTSGICPPELRVPLLFYVVPLFESQHCPFSRDDVQQLMQVLAAATSPAAAAAGSLGGGGGGGATGPQLRARNVADVRLALVRALARVQLAAV